MVARLYQRLARLPLWAIVLLWLLPSFGLFVNSFRPKDAQRYSAWWTLAPDGLGERFTLDNYDYVLHSGTTVTLGSSLLNSIAIAIPATIVPLLLATTAAYGFAWLRFPARRLLFLLLIVLMAMPVEVVLIPLLRLSLHGAHVTPGELPLLGAVLPFNKTITLVPAWNYNGTAFAAAIVHTALGLPFGIFLIHNYLLRLPRDLIDSSTIDGASHLQTLRHIVWPLSRPVLAAYSIFQFLWVWNDYRVNLVMTSISNGGVNQPSTVYLSGLTGSFGEGAYLLSAATFIQAAIPLLVFFGLQRHFVRGLVGGAASG